MRKLKMLIFVAAYAVISLISAQNQPPTANHSVSAQTATAMLTDSAAPFTTR